MAIEFAAIVQSINLLLLIWLPSTRFCLYLCLLESRNQSLLLFFGLPYAKFDAGAGNAIDTLARFCWNSANTLNCTDCMSWLGTLCISGPDSADDIGWLDVNDMS